MDKKLLEFPITLYGETERVNDVLIKARCRIFYTLGNRNGTFITEDFAKELISTLPYVPVKGIYEDGDFTDHGTSRSEGKIYGIVPETNNFAWEEHEDVDGVVRVYACSDVYLYAALYPEVSEIAGKSLSMELYKPSLVYHIEVIDGIRYAVFDHGSFLGLQVLGDEVEPCFEGASFFSLQSSIENAIRKIKEYSMIGGKSEMSRINFQLSDREKFDKIWDLLNVNYNEENDWAVDYCIIDIYDDYCLVVNHVNDSYERVYYTKNDETGEVTLGERIQVFIIDVTEAEKNTVETLRQLNGGTYALVSENLTNADANAESCVNFSTKIEELNDTITTLNIEVQKEKSNAEAVNAQYAAAQEQISALEEENQSLTDYKKNVENKAKEAVIAEYNDKLSAEVLENYRQKLDEYSVTDLDMHLAYEMKKTGTAFFTQVPQGGVIPKEVQLSGTEEILARYKQ